MCGRLFTPDILPEFLPADLYKKYCDHALQFNKIFGLEDYELLTNCLNENCTEKYIIWKDAGINNYI
jgi:E3 ubiquitin-protein ligase RNF14